MKFDLQSIIAIVVSLFSGVIGFFIAKSQLKDDINQLKIDQERLKSRDNLQQFSIDAINKEINKLIPALMDALNKKKKNGK